MHVISLQRLVLKSPERARMNETGMAWLKILLSITVLYSSSRIYKSFWVRVGGDEYVQSLAKPASPLYTATGSFT